MNTLRSNPNRRTGRGIRALAVVLGAGALVGSLTSCADDNYDTERITTSIGVSCEGGENIFVSQPYTPGTEETPFTPNYPIEAGMNDDEVDVGDYALVVACETGPMTIQKIANDSNNPSSLGARPQLDAIIEVTTEDKSGHREADGQNMGYATSQSVNVTHYTGDNTAYISFNNADTVQGIDVIQPNGTTEFELAK